MNTWVKFHNVIVIQEAQLVGRARERCGFQLWQKVRSLSGLSGFVTLRKLWGPC